MSNEEMNEFVLWYLSKEGYEKSAKIFENSIQSENKLSKEKIKIFLKIIEKVKKEKQERFVLQLIGYDSIHSL